MKCKIMIILISFKRMKANYRLLPAHLQQQLFDDDFTQCFAAIMFDNRINNDSRKPAPHSTINRWVATTMVMMTTVNEKEAVFSPLM